MFIRSKAELTALRMKKGLSQRKLARLTGLSVGCISQIETGKRNPTPATAQKICQALEVEFDSIFEIAEDREALAG